MATTMYIHTHTHTERERVNNIISVLQVVSFDGSTSIQEFVHSLNKCLGMRDCSLSGFALFTDDPAGKELEHCLKPHHKVCN